MRKRPGAASESQIQTALIQWWAYAHRGLGVAREGRLFAVPNGGHRSARTAGIMKGEGVRRGVADLLLLVPRGGYHGLAVEMKRPGGRLRPEQAEFLKELTADGYATAVCFSTEDAIKVLTFYLRMTTKPAAAC